MVAHYIVLRASKGIFGDVFVGCHAYTCHLTYGVPMHVLCAPAHRPWASRIPRLPTHSCYAGEMKDSPIIDDDGDGIAAASPVTHILWGQGDS